jgi:hypothetical protein
MSHSQESIRAFQDNMDDPRHGTANGNINLKCTCPPCQTAGREYHRKYKRIFRRVHGYGQECPEDQHGRWNGYCNYGCRCTPCREAASAQRLIWKANKAAKLAAETTEAPDAL